MSKASSLLQKAIDLATEAHKGQYRKDGKEYITHPLAVMKILEDLGFGETALISAVLHDISEDCMVNNFQIVDLFGERVGFIINTLSKIKKPEANKELEERFNKESNLKKYKDINNYRLLIYVNQIYIGMQADPFILFIKMADHIHNLSNMESLSPQKRKRKIEEVEIYYLPIYKKASKIVTPMYKDKYKKLLNTLEKTVNESKKEYLVRV